MRAISQDHTSIHPPYSINPIWSLTTWPIWCQIKSNYYDSSCRFILKCDIYTMICKSRVWHIDLPAELMRTTGAVRALGASSPYVLIVVGDDMGTALVGVVCFASFPPVRCSQNITSPCCELIHYQFVNLHQLYDILILFHTFSPWNMISSPFVPLFGALARWSDMVNATSLSPPMRGPYAPPRYTFMDLYTEQEND
jgi:hypothetical protein